MINWVCPRSRNFQQEQKAAAGEGGSSKTGSSKRWRPAADETDRLEYVMVIRNEEALVDKEDGRDDDTNWQKR